MARVYNREGLHDTYTLGDSYVHILVCTCLPDCTHKTGGVIKMLCLYNHIIKITAEIYLLKDLISSDPCGLPHNADASSVVL